MSERCQFLPPARPPGRSPEEGSARALALRHPLPVALMLVALGDRTGRVPGSLAALGLLADLARGRAERVDAALAVRHAGAQRAELGCGIVLRQAEVERLVLQLGEIRRDLASRITPARLVLVGGGAQRLKADLGIGEALGADAPQHRAGARCERQTDGDAERGGRAAMREGIRRHCWFTHVQVSNI